MTDDPRERAEQRTLLMPRRDTGGALAAGQRLQEYVIERLLGVGGYSIVYLARDTRLDRRVALKEFLPATLALRAPDGQIVPRLPRFADAYDKGLQGFVNEARLLGQFDHPALLKVHRFWQERGTAYMAMPYYEGITLARWLGDLGTPPSERWLRQLADALMDALETMHAKRCWHRDVAPDNILMLYDRAEAGAYLEQPPRPVLLDFGAARRVIGDATQTLTAVLKSGYSPLEQYESEAPQRQGPWTDVYALSAVLYTAATGLVPAASVSRVVHDALVPARVAAQGRYGVALLDAIDAGMALRPADRPPSIEALRRRLDSRHAAAPRSAAEAAAAAAASPSPSPSSSPPPAATAAAAAAPSPTAAGLRHWWPVALGAALLLAAIVYRWLRA
ncbi:MAG: serine/threonine protein kinase [Burkholderiales bacterium]|nr:serine/threonine protein kinase [Burkholderiales bacterium]